MIFGNPRLFAIRAEVVPEWCNGPFLVGLLDVYVGGVRLSGENAIAVTLPSAIQQFLASRSMDVEGHSKPYLLPLNLQNLNVDALFLKLEELTYPIDADDEAVNCWDYVISPYILEDFGFRIFFFKDKFGREKLVAGSIRNCKPVLADLAPGTLAAIIKEVNLAIEKLRAEFIGLTPTAAP